MAPPLPVMFIGTCRVREPRDALAGDPRINASATAHRFHTTRQTLQFLNHLNGTAPYRPEMLHLVSDHAAGEVLGLGTPRIQVLERLATVQKIWAAFEVFVIEISTRREFLADVGAQELTVNTRTIGDQKTWLDEIVRQAEQGLSLPPVAIRAIRTTAAEVLRDMKSIKHAVGGRAVIWVSHMRPPSDDPQYEVVKSARSDLARILRQGASTLGDAFVDPSETAAVMGQAAFFKNDGTDLEHLTPAAAVRMAQVYADLALRVVRQPAPPAL